MLSNHQEQNTKSHQQPLRRSCSKDSLSKQKLWRWSRHELAYVLTVDKHIYRRVVQESGDLYGIPCGMFYCNHDSESGVHMGIGVAVGVLLGIYFMLVHIIVWPTW